MSQKTERVLHDVAKWFHEHKAECSDPDKRTRFLEKAVDHLIWLNTYLVEDIQELEGRKKIVLPVGMKLHDDIRV